MRLSLVKLVSLIVDSVLPSVQNLILSVGYYYESRNEAESEFIR